jgi:hypothetical protein
VRGPRPPGGAGRFSLDYSRVVRSAGDTLPTESAPFLPSHSTPGLRNTAELLAHEEVNVDQNTQFAELSKKIWRWQSGQLSRRATMRLLTGLGASLGGGLAAVHPARGMDHHPGHFNEEAVDPGSVDAKAKLVTSTSMVVDTSYTADPNPDLVNPERGMYFGGYPTGRQSHTIVAKWLYLDQVCDQNLTWDRDNPNRTSPVLSAYAATLKEARANDVKVLFRPRYDTPSGSRLNRCGRFHADTKSRQLNHITAIAQMLGAYKDVVAFIQAGYLGRWGEWNDGGPEFGPSTVPLLYDERDRSDIIDHVLSEYAAHGITQDVELRTPVFAKEVVERYEKLNRRANVGLHNDCFMRSNASEPVDSGSDGGTYSDFPGGSPQNFGSTKRARDWAEAWTKSASFGGETCPANGNERWRFCSNMIGSNSEPASLHMDYLNGDYADDAVETWDEGDLEGDVCYDEIRRRLGYRFEVTRVEYLATVSGGVRFRLRVTIENTGWGKLHKPRTPKLVLRRGSKRLVYNLPGVVSSWEAGQTTIISFEGPTPLPGTYNLRLWIPDPDAESRIPYAVKFATKRNGASIFDSATGENDLGVSMTVQ